MIAAERVTGRRTSTAKAAWIRIAGASGLLAALPFVFRLNGKPHADWLQLFGRFHPVLLHIPIGLIVLLPILEIAGTRRPALRDAADFVLRAALVAALPTLVLGYMLAYGAGDTGSAVTRHMVGAIALCMGLMLCIVARASWMAHRRARLYPSLLSATILILIWTSHQGGSITHGGDYLTRYMPSFFRSALGVHKEETASPDSFYVQQIHPVLDSKCVSCHNATSAKADLRLDTYNHIMHGGKDGAVVTAGNPETSTILARVTLPANDKHFMPAEGRTPLSSQEVSLIRAWIRAGASPTALTVPGINIAAYRSEPPPPPVGDYTALMPEIRHMQDGQGAKLVPVSKAPADGLILRTVDIAPSFGDSQLLAFKKYGPYIVEAELGRTALTDASFETLGTFVHLRALHLEGTQLTGSGLAKLANLKELRYLNLSSTGITPQAASVLKTLPSLHHIYLFDTAAQIEPASIRNAQ